ncbi:MAG: TSUP family transporter [Crocinitomicaceae bacterium]|jgi:siroheme synthase-like protein
MKKFHQTNNLFPIFLKGNELRFLIVGGGEVALEKMTALFNNSPEAIVRVVAKEYSESTLEFLKSQSTVEIIHGAFEEKYLEGIQIMITALNDKELSAELKKVANAKGLLYNAADKPDYCDFYLGSVVQKGNLKLGISTNGKSPTMAKRIKELLNEVIPDEIDDSIENMQEIRGHIKGDFKQRILKLNKITSSLIKQKKRKWFELEWKKVIFSILGVLAIMLAGHAFFSLMPPKAIWTSTVGLVDQLDSSFLYFMLGGFIAQMIDGALGMAYGLSATTFLMNYGVPISVASMSVHASEIFTSGVSGLMHLKFGNVHNRLFKAIVIPGVIGAILGAYVLTEFEKYGSYIKPIVSVYTLFLGALIIYKVIRKNQNRKKVKRAGLLATLGGFLDSIGGGGWGPVVSSTLIAHGKNPRLVVGSVNLAEFFVSLASSLTFITILGSSHWQTILGLILGGVCAAPIAAHLSKKLNVKAMMLFVGIVVIIISLRTIVMFLIK